MVEWLTNHVLEFFNAWGYAAGFEVMALESMIAPVPSEAVMPPMGMLVAQGKMTRWLAVGATSAGSLAGSLLSYAIGYWGGKPLVLKFGKYMFLNEHHLEWTDKWFHRHGGGTIFIGRFIPVVRHLISIPAGTGKMPLLPFCVFTVIGATIWNAILLFAGMKLQDHWDAIIHSKWRHWIDVGVVAVLAVAAVWFFYTHLYLPAKRNRKAA